jgi:transposase
MSTKRKKRAQDLPVLHPDAAGIDVGANEVFVAVPADRDLEPARSFATFTRDLHVLADWLKRCRIQSVAMESTSVYSIPKDFCLALQVKST